MRFARGDGALRRHTSRWLACALASAIALSAVPAGAYTVSGVVRDAETGAPLSGVRVRGFSYYDIYYGITDQIVDATVTAGDGAYTIDMGVTEGFLMSYSDPGGVYRDEYSGGQLVPPEYCWGLRTWGENRTGVDQYMTTLAGAYGERSVRIAGANRYGTAVEVSKQNFSAADTVVIASGETFPDGLSAAPLAGAYGAPLLLTPRATMPSYVGEEIRRLGATKAYIIGGTGAVSSVVENNLGYYGITSVERIAGANRYDTAAKITHKIVTEMAGYSGPIFLVRGDDFPDALAAAPYAARQLRPILLTAPDRAPLETRVFVSTHAYNDEFIVVGGEGAVSDDVLYGLAGAHPAGEIFGVRIAGLDRYDTAAQLAWAWEVPYDTIGVANGLGFADALAGGVGVGMRGGALLLAPPSGLTASAQDLIYENSPYLWPVQVFGGSAVLGSGVIADIAYNNDADRFDHDDHYFDVDAPWFGGSVPRPAELAPASPSASAAVRASALQDLTAEERPAQKLAQKLSAEMRSYRR